MGRRLAFDAAKGRLWVVCGKCKRWNLSPLETRWEAIEEAERAFRSTRLRVATEHIGLAQLADGTELIRVGKPLRAEFAAWRYGDQFARRYKAFVAAAAGSAVVANCLPIIGSWHVFEGRPVLGLVAPSLSVLTIAGLSVKAYAATYRPTISIRDGTGKLLRLSKRNAQNASLTPAGHAFEWQLTVPHLHVTPSGKLLRLLGMRETGTADEHAVLRDGEAKRALATLLPHANVAGGGRRAVQAAVDVVNDTPNLHYLLHRASIAKPVFRMNSSPGAGLGNLPASLRLALEMILHEEDERRAMEGELQDLEERWRDAETIAKIADALLLPESVNTGIEELRSAKDRAGCHREP